MIVAAADWISWGLGKGTEGASKLVKYSSNKLRTSLTPEQEEKEINPQAEQVIVYTRQATGSAVAVSRFLVQRLGEATMALANYAAPQIKHHGAKFLPKSGEGKSKMDGITEVAASGIKGSSCSRLTDYIL